MAHRGFEKSNIDISSVSLVHFYHDHNFFVCGGRGEGGRGEGASVLIFYGSDIEGISIIRERSS